MKKVLKIVGILLLIVILAIGVYAAYVFTSNKRIADMQEQEIRAEASEIAPVGKEISILSWNIGFGAYIQDYGFFMDGGKESWARSKEKLDETLNHMAELVGEKNADLTLLQEVDFGGTRTYKIDEREYFYKALPGRDSSFAVNWQSPFLLYPFKNPQGFIRAGILTESRFQTENVIRRQLPVEKGVSSIVDMDRCYTVSRIPTENGKNLCVYNFHLSAYTTDGTIAVDQMAMMLADMKAEYELGNYVVGGGDFNKDLLGDSGRYFGVSTAGYNWTQPVRTEIIEENKMLLQVPVDEEHPIPTCRNADGPYSAEQLVITIDGFLVSPNVTVINKQVIDTAFAYSDHNPIEMTVILQTEE